MSHKSSYSYKIIFNLLEKLVKTMKINFGFNDTHKITDFEYQLRKTINEIIYNLEGSYFHYSKSPRTKRKNWGQQIKNT